MKIGNVGRFQHWILIIGPTPTLHRTLLNPQPKVDMSLCVFVHASILPAHRLCPHFFVNLGTNKPSTWRQANRAVQTAGEPTTCVSTHTMWKDFTIRQNSPDWILQPIQITMKEDNGLKLYCLGLFFFTEFGSFHGTSELARGGFCTLSENAVTSVWISLPRYHNSWMALFYHVKIFVLLTFQNCAE